MDKKKIAILSNVTVDMVAAKLRKKYSVYIPDGFDMWITDVLNDESALYSNNIQAVIILLDGTEFRSLRSGEEFSQRVALWRNATEKLIEKITDIPIFVSTIDFRESAIRTYSERKYYIEWADEWYQFVQSLAESKKNVYVMDILQRILNEGRNSFYSNKMWYMGSMPYSKNGIIAVVDEISKALSAVFESRKKIIALDLDNTLWGGVIGEDGINGVELSEHKEGARFYDFQLRLLEMQKRGILLAINSKNNCEDAMEAIENHPHMLLRKNSFVSEKINWNDKSSNIKEMETELNLTEGAFVFIDDNPVEREVVSGQCPDVLIPEFPVDTTDLVDMAEKLYINVFKSLSLTDEDKAKTQMYQTEAKRKAIQSSTLDLDDYIKVLEMRADIHLMCDEELERVHQLCNKTNQFNLTTKRYTQKEISDMLADVRYDIFTISSSDKFGDNGLVGVAICERKEKAVVIDTFLMSCRVMGRKLENVIISELVKYYKGQYNTMIGLFVQTKKNIPVVKKYDELGFAVVSEDESGKTYSYDISKGCEKVNSYSEIIFNGEHK
ncbi:MAG: HAD-IIIC family phosphatase [Ruminococcus sp.]|jgi:FkbH-like protein|nr:HAD-IIIC family phosphatase [Ruminococcus sp.]